MQRKKWLVSFWKVLKTFPPVGLPVNKAPDPSVIKDLFIGSYVVRYLLASEEVYILRSWYGKETEKGL